MFAFVVLWLMIIPLLIAGASIGHLNAAENSTSTLPPLEEHQSSTLASIDTDYKNKICKGEPTCHMIEQVPLNLHSLKNRNCMCDAECSKYGDCCSDSPYYNEAEQKVNFQQFYCLPSISVYSKVTCPPTYSNAEVTSKCYLSKNSTTSNEIKIMTPVTNIQRGITYGNEYCAMCNGVTEFRTWNLSFWCTASIPLTSANAPNDSFETSNPDFDPVSNMFVVMSNGTRRFVCNLTTISKPLEVETRSCKSVLSTCPPGIDNKLCESQTAIVYVNGSSSKAYRNKYCAECNGESGVFEPCLVAHVSTKVGLAVLFRSNTADTVECGTLEGDVKNKFC